MDRYEVEDILGEFSFCEYKGDVGTIPYRLHIPDGGAEECSYICKDVLKADMASLIRSGKLAQ